MDKHRAADIWWAVSVLLTLASGPAVAAYKAITLQDGQEYDLAFDVVFPGILTSVIVLIGCLALALAAMAIQILAYPRSRK